MLSVDVSSGSAPDNWLRQHGNWNVKKTIAKTSFYNTPCSVLCDARAEVRKIDYLTTDNDSNIRDVVFAADGRGLTCITCKMSFKQLSLQQEHFKSDFHRLNLRRNLKGMNALSEFEFKDFQSADIAENEDNNNDDSSSDEDEISDSELNGNENDGENVKMESDVTLNVFSSEEGSVSKQFIKGGGPVFVFRRANQLLEWEFSISSAAFHPQSEIHSKSWHVGCNAWDMLAQQWQRMQSNTMSCVMLLRSGRFAAVIFDGDKIVIHKVLRRYTVRAKAGGGQSSHDNKGGKAKSAGAMLRRYGEQALKEDILEILKLWSGYLQSCGVIYISAPKTMRSTLFGVDNTTGSPLQKEDSRVMFVPFIVDKPTLDEARYVHSRCTSIVFTKRNREKAVTFSGDKGDRNDSTMSKNNDDEDEDSQLFRNDSSKRDRKREKKRSETHDLSTLSLEECGPSRELVEACVKGDDKAAVRLLKRLHAIYSDNNDPAILINEEEEDGDSDRESAAPIPSSSEMLANNTADTFRYSMNTILNTPDSLANLNTPLHIASANSMTQTVALLLTLNADPTRVDVRGRPPYFVCVDKNTRDAYRRYRGVVGEERYNWSVTGVAAALTEDIEQEKRNKEKEKKRRAAQRKKEQKIAAEIAAKEAQDALERQKQLEVEIAAKRQREAGTCGGCGVSLFGIKTLDVYDRRCCSAKCVIALRRQLTAEAAMKRFGK